MRNHNLHKEFVILLLILADFTCGVIYDVSVEGYNPWSAICGSAVLLAAATLWDILINDNED